MHANETENGTKDPERGSLERFVILMDGYPVRLSAYVSLIKVNMCQDQCRWRRLAVYLTDTRLRIRIRMQM